MSERTDDTYEVWGTPRESLNMYSKNHRLIANSLTSAEAGHICRRYQKESDTKYINGTSPNIVFYTRKQGEMTYILSIVNGGRKMGFGYKHYFNIESANMAAEKIRNTFLKFNSGNHYEVEVETRDDNNKRSRAITNNSTTSDITTHSFGNNMNVISIPVTNVPALMQMMASLGIRPEIFSNGANIANNDLPADDISSLEDID